MKITFNGVVIAQEFADGGTDSVTGFQPKAKGVSQLVQPIRAAYAVQIARGNRQVTLAGVIVPAAAPTLEAAMLALETLYGSLPDTGDLVKEINGNTVTYPASVLESFETVEDLKGVSYGYRLTFVAGKPSADSPGATIGTEGGVSLGTESGGSLGTES